MSNGKFVSGTKLENPITIDLLFNLVVFILEVKFGIHLATLNFRTDMFKTLACKYSYFSGSERFSFEKQCITPLVNKSISLSAFT